MFDIAAIKDLSAELGVTLKTVRITPEMAREWLGFNEGNRNPSKGDIDRWSRDMASEVWDLNGESMKFSSIRLLDGQTRLFACVKSGKSFLSVVVWGLDDESQRSMDAGHKRQLRDYLKQHAYANSSALASALGLLWRDRTGIAISRSTYPTYHEAVGLLDDTPGLIEATVEGERTRKAIRGINGAVAAVLSLKMSEINQEDSDAFWARLRLGADLATDDPIYHLRKILTATRHRDSRGRIAAQQQWALTIKAWNAYCSGEPMLALRWRQGGAHPEEMPELNEVCGS